MFTGVVRGCGVLQNITRTKSGARLELVVPKNFPPIKIGGSVSVNGACLTAVKTGKNRLFFDVVHETLRRSNFRDFKKGTRVHLEPALRWNGRLEGHLVQGHVDGVGAIGKISRGKSGVRLDVLFPAPLEPYLLEKGSVAINGVSLTLGKVGKKSFAVHLIPHTLKLTNFRELETGSRVNLEADILLKFLNSL